MTTEGSPFYVAGLLPLMTFELASNVAIVVLAVVTAWLFFSKSRRTPAFAIAFYALSAVCLLIDHVWVGSIPEVASGADASSMKELARAIVVAAVWIPYFLVSKRVKNTFTK